jgi:hypothetical protein
LVKGAPAKAAKAQQKRDSCSAESDSSIDFDLPDDDEVEEISTEQTAVVRFLSSSSAGSPSTASSHHSDMYFGLDFDQQMLIDSLTPPAFLDEPMRSLFDPPIPPLDFSVAGLTPTDFSHTLQFQSPSQITAIPRSLSPKGSRTLDSLFYLQYHREAISEAHYFRSYDYNKFCTKTIFTMAEESDAMRYALIAFSALIYSIKIHPPARVDAFLYYAMALRELHQLLGKEPMELWECQAAIATALQLSTFDVHSFLYLAKLKRFFNDPAKCFKHLGGAAHILQKVTTPYQLCSTAAGRALLEWYTVFETYCCFLAAYPAFLPREWRDENVRTRERLAEIEYPRLSKAERKPRILDDILPQYLALVPRLGDVLGGIPPLQELQDPERANAAARLEAELRLFDDEVKALLNSPQVLEALEEAPIPRPFISRHAECCPDPPFTPHMLKYPPAGFFRMNVLAAQGYIRTIMWPPLRDAMGPGREGEWFDEVDVQENSVQICRSFAGLEYSLGYNPDNLIPSFSPLVLATVNCPPSSRLWLWCKLSHLEKLGHLRFDPVKRNLAAMWEMPELVNEGFDLSKVAAPPFRELSCDDIASAVAAVKLDDEKLIGDDLDDASTPLMTARGVFGLSPTTP